MFDRRSLSPEESFQIWDSLLQLNAKQQRSFLVILVDEMLLRLVEPPSVAARTSADPARESISAWLRHIYVDESWQAARTLAGIDAGSAVKMCLASPGHWTIRLASELIAAPQYEEVERVYGADVEAASQAFEQRTAPAPKTYEASPAALAVIDAWEEGGSAELAWVPTPIGVPSVTARRHVMPPQLLAASQGITAQRV